MKNIGLVFIRSVFFLKQTNQVISRITVFKRQNIKYTKLAYQPKVKNPLTEYSNNQKYKIKINEACYFYQR